MKEFIFKSLAILVAAILVISLADVAAIRLALRIDRSVAQRDEIIRLLKKLLAAVDETRPKDS